VGTPPKVEKTLHKMSNWILTGYHGDLVLVGDCYTRFPDADHPRVISSPLIAIKFDPNIETNYKVIAETQNSIYHLGEMKPSYEMALRMHGITIYSLCFDSREKALEKEGTKT